MAFEPINIFSYRIDPRGIAELLRRSGRVKVEGSDDDWRAIEVTLRKGTWFRKAFVLKLSHNAEYYAGGAWSRQVHGMQAYFSHFPEFPRKAKVLRAIGAFRFALSAPQDDLDISSQDERLNILYKVSQHLDGMIFTPSSLRDAQGRIFITAEGEYSDRSILPQVLQPDDQPSEDNFHGLEEDEHPQPPSNERVARRALALTALAARATLELDALELANPEVQRQLLLQWVAAIGIGDELEPDEWEVLQRPVGKLDQESFVNSMWRVEGLAVIAWALQLHDLPPDDELVVPPELYQSLGFLDAVKAGEILKTPSLRSREELDAMEKHLVMLHWRLRNYSLRPQAMDFVAFSEKCWIGSFDIETFRIIDRDLAIGDSAINDATDDQVRTAQSIAMERHLAINWLAGHSEIYSETDTST